MSFLAVSEICVHCQKPFNAATSARISVHHIPRTMSEVVSSTNHLFHETCFRALIKDQPKDSMFCPHCYLPIDDPFSPRALDPAIAARLAIEDQLLPYFLKLQRGEKLSDEEAAAYLKLRAAF
jgi:hypothetical protein